MWPNVPYCQKANAFMKLASLTVEYWKDPKLSLKFGFLATLAALIITVFGLLFVVRTAILV